MVTRQEKVNNVISASLIVIVFSLVGYFAVLGYLAENTDKVNYDFDQIALDNSAFAEVGEGNSLILQSQIDSTIYSIVEENLTFENNVEKVTLNLSELDDYTVSFSYDLSVDSNYTGEELRIDSGLVADDNVTQVLSHSIAYDEVEKNYVFEIDGENLVLIEEYAVAETKGFDVVYEFDESSGFVEVEVVRVAEDDERRLIYNQVSSINDELKGNEIAYGTSFWINYLLVGNENTSITVNELSLTY